MFLDAFFLFANFGTFFLYPYTPLRRRGVGDGYVFGCIFFANFGTFFLYPIPPPPPPATWEEEGGRGRGMGRRWVCFWMHFFFANYGTFFLYPIPPPPHLGGGGEGGGDEVCF